MSSASHLFSPTLVSELISTIYEAAIDPAKWQTFVDDIHKKIDGVDPVFYVADRKSALMEFGLVAESWGQAFMDPYVAYFNQLNPWTPFLVDTPRLGEALRGDEYVRDNQIRNSEFYTDFFRHWGDRTSVVGLVPFRNEHAISVLGLHTSRRMFARHTADLGHLLECLSPHINRAFSISRLLGHGQALRSTLDMMMDALDRPALVVGSDLRVRQANARAEALFSEGTLGLDPFRRLTCGHRLTETKALHDAIHVALTEDADERAAPTPVRISQARDVDGETVSLLAWAMPCGHEPGDTLDAITGAAAASMRRQVLVILATPSSNTQIPAQALSILYGLTPAEARLAGAIAGGASVKEYAEEHGNTEGTVRAQLKSVFAKTGTHRQAELAALLASISPPAPSRC